MLCGKIAMTIGAFLSTIILFFTVPNPLSANSVDPLTQDTNISAAQSNDLTRALAVYIMLILLGNGLLVKLKF